MSLDEQHMRETLVKLAKEAMAADESLREQHNIGEKFRFVKDRLADIAEELDEHFEDFFEEDMMETDVALSDDETMVFVHLFNAQGMLLESWSKMLTPRLFYEYSINRPIFENKDAADAYIRSKANKNQHAYLAVVVKKASVRLLDETTDGVIKVAEGALDVTRLKMFVHDGKEYILNDEGELGLL